MVSWSQRVMRWALLLVLLLPCLGRSDDEASPERITLKKIENRYWLVDAKGEPFFAHGITHANNRQADLDFQKFASACKELGFNAYGYGCPDDLRSDMPFIEGWNHLVPISYYRGSKAIKFIDVFDPKEQAKLEAGVQFSCRRARKHADNLIGYCWTDLACWPLENPADRNWVDFIRGLPDEAPGKEAYKEFDGSWEGNEPTERDQAFLKLIAREYFRVIGQAQRKYDPGRLVFGDRFAFNTIDRDVLSEMLPYVDAIAIQPNFWGEFPKAKFDELHELTGKPILVCDFAIRFKDGNKDIRNWRMAENSTAAGIAYANYVKQAMQTRYVLGVFWCNPVDTGKGFGKAGIKQGFFGDGLSERPGLHTAVRKVNDLRESLTPKPGDVGRR